jgi:23S rRNA pseudouridine2605 synthase
LLATLPYPKPAAYNRDVNRFQKKQRRQTGGEGSRRTGLARAISKLGYCSRSQAAELVRAGKVKLNGSVTRNPEAPVRMERDRVEIDERLVTVAKKAYLMMNKPRGIVTTAADEKGRTTVYDLLEEWRAGQAATLRLETHWVAPVGRLDKASEGLLLLTNDSEWGARIAAPETHLDKTYHVQIGTIADEALVRRLEGGIEAENGEFLRVKHARVLRQGDKNSWLEIMLDEGKNRQIRRILDQLGIEVLRLVRVSIGSLRLGDLPKGAIRSLTAEEGDTINRTMCLTV